MEVEEYRTNVAKYVVAGLHRGDWSIVELMATRSADLPGMMVNLPIGNPFEVFRFNRLLRLGATGRYATLLDDLAGNVQGELSKEEAAQAQAWAQHEFETYFSNSPQLERRPVACENPFLVDA